MKVAILHDYLNQFGGAERVLKTLLEIFPQADLYTLLYDKTKNFLFFEDKVIQPHIKKTSFLDKEIVRRHHRFFIPLMPLAARYLKSLIYYDLIISSTAGYAKGFNVKGAFHLCYCHSPLRYAWEIDYLNFKFLIFNFKFWKRFFKPILNYLKKWDYQAAQKPDIFIANSEFITDKIRNYYHRSARVIYPPVDLNKFYYSPPSFFPSYYLMVGRLLHYKNFDLGIKTFNILKKPLKIIGNGPERKRLQQINLSSATEFFYDLSDQDLRNVYVNAQALIFPQIEDFGLVAAEAQACGLPVIAYYQGGAREIVEDGRTGLLFKDQNPAALMRAIEDFEKMSFDRRYIAERAKRFSKDNFKRQIIEILKQHGFNV